MKPADYPHQRRRLGGAPARRLRPQPQRRARRGGLSRQRRRLADRAADVQRRRRQHDPLRAHFPRFHPSDFRVRTLDGVADDWPIDYGTLEPYYAEQRAHDGRVRPGRRSGVSAEGAAAAAGAARQAGRDPVRAGAQPARLALVAVRQRHRTRSTRAARRASTPGQCSLGCAQGAKASTDITYWPLALRAGVELRTRCRVREITVGENGMADGVIYYDANGRRAAAAGARWWSWPATASARRGCCSTRAPPVPRRAREPQRPGRQEPDVPSLRHGDRHLRRAARRLQGPTGCCIMSQEFYETDLLARLRARLLVRDPARVRSRPRAIAMGTGPHAVGRGSPPRLSPSCSTAAGMVVSARTCPRSTTASRSTRS